MYTALIGTLAVIDVGSWNVVAQCAEPFSSWIIISLVSLVLTLLMAIVCVLCAVVVRVRAFHVPINL